jgi:radical SAM superfamily enzyme YgiQ (UPF0313 family)
MKLGLIAMSGLRTHNEELTKMGFTLPGFMERSKVIASLPSLGLLTLAGMTPEGIEISYVEVPDIHQLARLPGEYDVVAISSFTAQIRDAYRLADHYRKAGTKVLLGGLHVTALPSEASQHADAIVIGEGEPAWPTVLTDMKQRRLKQIYDSRTQNFDLSDAPMPRFELLDPDRYNRLTVQTQRGCPFRCEFCASSIRISPTYKVKPTAKVIAEIRRIKEIWPKPFIEFADDNTFVNKKHGKKLMHALEAEHIRWFTETDVSVAADDELLKLMRDSGCAQILIGFESPSLSGLDGLEKRANWKAKQLDRYKWAIDRIQGHGITVDGCFIFGLDGTGPESFEQVWNFVRDSGLYEVQITIQTAFPGTPLYDRLKKEGRLLRGDAWELCTLFDVNFRPTHMSKQQLESGFKDLAKKLYSEESTRERRTKFRQRLRRLPRMGKKQTRHS